MKSKNLLLVLIPILVFISGCATNGSNNQYKKPLCVVAGALVGGAAGNAIEDDDAKGAAAGAVVGAAVAWLFCDGESDTDGDGVMDSKDSCRGTPKGTAVGTNGCALDRDGDGVPDAQDQCPDTKRGTGVDGKGCPFDSDSDGVTDDKDRCPSTPRGVAVDGSGCPLDGDGDGDGVYDSKDQCRDTPSGASVNTKGCHTILSLKGVLFAFNSSELGQQAKTDLGVAVKILNDDPGANLRVEGHTDSTGDDSYNQVLSQARADSVVDYLVMNGVDRSRLTPVGYGKGSPVASNDTNEGRASNRRVDLVDDN